MHNAALEQLVFFIVVQCVTTIFPRFMKQKFSSIDVRWMSKCVQQEISSARLQNIYEITPKTFLLKFSLAGSNNKYRLLVESGIRFHPTEYESKRPASSKSNKSPFLTRLRKCCKGKRVEEFGQLADDRIIKFVFGSGEYECRLYVEFYASGNVILTDSGNNIMAILRTVKHGKDADGANIGWTIGQQYVPGGAQVFPDLSPLLIKEHLQKCIPLELTLRQAMIRMPSLQSVLVDHILYRANGSHLRNKKISLDIIGGLFEDDEKTSSIIGEIKPFIDGSFSTPHPQGYLLSEPAKGQAHKCNIHTSFSTVSVHA